MESTPAQLSGYENATCIRVWNMGKFLVLIYGSTTSLDVLMSIAFCWILTLTME